MIEIIKKFMCLVIVATFSTATCMKMNTSNLPIISSLLCQYCAKSTTNYSLHELRKIHKKKQLKLSEFIATHENAIVHPDKKLTTTYLKLQNNIKTSQVIPLFHCQNMVPAKAAYCYEIKAILTFFYFQLFSFSQQIGLLLHELRHVQQYTNANFQFPSDILLYKKKYELTKNQLKELDADLFVAKTLQCPTCLRMYQITLATRRDPDGYASKKDFEPFIKKATTYCKAHADHDVNKLNKAIAHDDLIKAIKLDNRIGNLNDRMPPFN